MVLWRNGDGIVIQSPEAGVLHGCPILAFSFTPGQNHCKWGKMLINGHNFSCHLILPGVSKFYK